MLCCDLVGRQAAHFIGADSMLAMCVVHRLQTWCQLSGACALVVVGDLHVSFGGSQVVSGRLRVHASVVLVAG